jgi:hypothetical protein
MFRLKGGKLLYQRTVPKSTTGDVQQWLARSKARAGAVLEAVRTSLYENFKVGRVDTGAAAAAYGQLCSALGRSADDGTLVCATTNYDPAAEVALEALGFDVHDGFPRTLHWQTPVLQPEGLVATCRRLRAPEAVAVLHLHGAVGWYRAADGRIEFHSPDQPYNRSLGVPALLLPDPRKDPSLYAGVDAIWRELAFALESASHVLVVGHSLHDRHLVDQLRTAHAKLAVTVLPDQDDTSSASELLPGATVVQLRFASELAGDLDGLREWFSAT